MKEEKRELSDLQKNKSYIIFPADKGVALAMVGKDVYIDK